MRYATAKKIAGISIAITLIALLAFIALSPHFHIPGNEKAIIGDWHLTYKRDCSADGTDASDRFSIGDILTISESDADKVRGKFHEASFFGTVSMDLVRFDVKTAGGTIRMMCDQNPGKLLNISAVSDENGRKTAHMLLFTRDSKMPHMTDMQSYTVSGKWKSQVAYDRADRVKSMELDLHQNVSILYGKMKVNGTEKNTCISLSMLQNHVMNAGLMLDSDGTLWAVNVKKGFMSLFTSEVVSGEVSEINVYMVRDLGNAYYLPEFTKFNNSTWTGIIAYDATNTSKSITNTTIRFEQADYRVRGVMDGGITGTLVFYIYTTYHQSGEIMLVSDGKVAKGTLLVLNQDRIKMLFHEGEVSADKFNHMEFGRSR